MIDEDINFYIYMDCFPWRLNKDDFMFSGLWPNKKIHMLLKI